jgi:hypothetical protein
MGIDNKQVVIFLIVHNIWANFSKFEELLLIKASTFFKFIKDPFKGIRSIVKS